MDDKISFSIVIPVYMAQNVLIELHRQLKEVLEGIEVSYEILFVEDSSPDKSWQAIEEICLVDRQVKGIKLSRNFGQHYAISAGLVHASGEWIVVMDCDLQDKPDQIPKMYQKALEGFDIVQGSRVNRKDSFFKRKTSYFFYKTLAYLSGFNQDSTIANFGIYNKKVINAIVALPEKIRFFPSLVMWVGFSRTVIDIEHSDRAEGKSSYSFKKLMNLGLDVILAYSEKPLRMIIKVGILTAFFAMIFAVFTFYKYLSGEIIVAGYASVIISIWFLSGIIMFVLGVVGLYVARTFESVKDRPLFIIEKIIN